MSYMNHRDFGGRPEKPERKTLLQQLRDTARDIMDMLARMPTDIAAEQHELVAKAKQYADFVLTWEELDVQHIAEIISHHQSLGVLWGKLLLVEERSRFSEGR